MSQSTLQKIKEYDDARPGFPGEHWLVLGAGLAVWLLSARHPSPVVKALGLLAGTALVGRAASGRDGVVALLRYLPVGSSIRRLELQPPRLPHRREVNAVEPD